MTATENNSPKHFAGKSYPNDKNQNKPIFEKQPQTFEVVLKPEIELKKTIVPDLKSALNSKSVHKGLACLNDKATTLMSCQKS